MMNYKDSIEYLESFWKFGIKLGLERIEYLLYKLENPHKKFKSIHIAGTNGKGSVCAFVSSILKESGLKAGMYTSPHLIKYEERFKINGEDISEKDFCFYIEKIKKVIDHYPNDMEKPTEFEILTALAFLYFADEKTDIAVIETGLGGRLDSTNVINPLVTAITNVDFDHIKILGETIEDIAKEKAGIIKANIPCVTAADGKALEVILRKCKEMVAPIRLITKKNPSHLTTRSPQLSAPSSQLKNFIPLSGNHQLINAQIAIGIIEELNKIDFKITDKQIKNGLSKTRWPARFQKISNNPAIIIDGAHNPAGTQALLETLDEFYPNKKIIFVLGILSYKDYAGMIKIFIKKSKIFFVGKPNNPLACDPNLICKEVHKSNIEYSIAKTIPEAILEAKNNASKEDIICIAGSLYTAGEALKYLNGVI